MLLFNSLLFLKITLTLGHMGPPGNEGGDNRITDIHEDIRFLKSSVETLMNLVTMANTRLIHVFERLDGTRTEVDLNKRAISKITKQVAIYSGHCMLLSEGVCGPCMCREDSSLLAKYYCDCRHIPAKRDCKQFHQEGFDTTGVYNIHLNKLYMMTVFCQQDVDGGGWIVIQRRVDGSVKFNRDYKSYKAGFGQVQKEFWLGNSNLFHLSISGLSSGGNELRIEVEGWNGIRKYAKYSKFGIGSEITGFELNVDGYSGSAGDSFTYQSGRKFSTLDNDNDFWKEESCALKYHGAWWYSGGGERSNCFHACLNGEYYDYGKSRPSFHGINWNSFYEGGNDYSLKFTEMKVRRKT